MNQAQEQTQEQAQPVSVEESIIQAMEEIEAKNAANDEGDEAEDGKDPKDAAIPAEVDPARPAAAKKGRGKAAQKAAEEPEKPQAPEEGEEGAQDPAAKAKEKVVEAPQSWGAAVKEKWGQLPADVQAEIVKRETDIHQMMTRHDGELRLGREMKEVITPYMPVLQSVNATPAAAVQNLLNNDYILRTGNPAQKAQLAFELLNYYGIDARQIAQAAMPQQQIDPMIRQVLDRVQGIEQKFTQQMTLQEQEEDAKIRAAVQAFAADPKNVHYEKVKPRMGNLIASGEAKDLQEAYEIACWADPEVRSTLIKAQEKEQAEKRKQEAARKKQAAASVTGSPGLSQQQPNSTPRKSLEQELSDTYDELMGAD